MGSEDQELSKDIWTEIGFIDDFRIIEVRALIDGASIPSDYLLNIARVTT